MFEFLKRLNPFGHKHFHGHSHGRGSPRIPRQKSSMRNEALPFEENTFQCPLCEKHCPLNDPCCRKGAAFAKKLASAKGD
ncbi:MAG: hypothetical protein LBS31_02900 [Candidatus Adiutrix sp.]|jgi:hypothetical protein|nr:hypothetical protein [Candidatus Adiutrix sp.]